MVQLLENMKKNRAEMFKTNITLYNNNIKNKSYKPLCNGKLTNACGLGGLFKLHSKES